MKPIQWYPAILGLLLCSFSACSASVTPHGLYAEASRSAVIVVAGYYGTKLSRVDNGELLWVTATQAFGGAQSLIMPLPDLALDGVALRPSGILDEVRVVPWLYSFEVYRPLLAELGRLHGGHVSIEPLNYDWRLDLMDAVRLLSAEIRRLKSQGITHISLVAHSMGGLIVSYYLRYGDQELERAVETWEGTAHVEKVVMAGVPFLGSMWSFRNMQYGRLIGLNNSLLDQQAMASFPASYYTLPALGADVLLTPTSQPIRGAIHTPANWWQQGWGLLKETPSPSAQIVERRDTYTACWLDRSQRFFNLLHAPLTTPNDRPIPLLYLYADGQRTLAKGVWIPEEAGPHRANVVFDKDQFEKRLPLLDPTIVHEDGDGSVTVTSASLPPAYEKAFQVTTERSQVGHIDLVTGRETRRSIAGFLEAQSERRP
ncbi:MAG: hypothetical protein SGJ26_02675 [Nitrospirota bacterium]|nr:hypothetical protein [Nitrospirota bacterium]